MQMLDRKLFQLLQAVSILIIFSICSLAEPDGVQKKRMDATKEWASSGSRLAEGNSNSQKQKQTHELDDEYEYVYVDENGDLYDDGAVSKQQSPTPTLLFDLQFRHHVIT